MDLVCHLLNKDQLLFMLTTPFASQSQLTQEHRGFSIRNFFSSSPEFASWWCDNPVPRKAHDVKPLLPAVIFDKRNGQSEAGQPVLPRAIMLLSNWVAEVRQIVAPCKTLVFSYIHLDWKPISTQLGKGQADIICLRFDFKY